MGFIVKTLLGFGDVWETAAAHVSLPVFIRQFKRVKVEGYFFMHSCFSDMEKY